MKSNTAPVGALNKKFLRDGHPLASRDDANDDITSSQFVTLVVLLLLTLLEQRYFRIRLIASRVRDI